MSEEERAAVLAKQEEKLRRAEEKDAMILAEFNRLREKHNRPALN